MTTLILSVFFSISASAYDVEVDGIYYDISGTTATVTSGNNKYSGDIVIPESITYNNSKYSVTSIGKSAFYICSSLTSVTIPNSVTWIGDWAFSGCENLKEIILYQTDPSKIKVSERSGLQKEQITLYVPNEGVAAFQKDPFWSECAAIKSITDDMLK